MEPAATTPFDGEEERLPAWEFRTHEEYLCAMEQIVKYNNYDWAKIYEVREFSVLTQLSSIIFPWSFPPDLMHIWFENIFPCILFNHQRGQFFQAHVLKGDKSKSPNKVNNRDVEEDNVEIRSHSQSPSIDEGSSEDTASIQDIPRGGAVRSQHGS